MIHLLFDLLAYLLAWLISRHFYAVREPWKDDDQKWYYYTAATVGFVIGAVGLSTVNNYLSLGTWTMGKSILGALLGAIVAVEIFKKATGIKGSTGAYFVPSLAVGIAVGRLGCFFAGVEDFTYGLPTTLPWGVDFGDGVLRHPVQLYESGMMFLFFGYAWWLYKKRRSLFEREIFYRFILFYAAQRFIWEFFKSYGTFIGGLNVFQWACLGLMIYAFYYLQRSRNGVLQPQI